MFFQPYITYFCANGSSYHNKHEPTNEMDLVSTPPCSVHLSHCSCLILFEPMFGHLYPSFPSVFVFWLESRCSFETFPRDHVLAPSCSVCSLADMHGQAPGGSGASSDGEVPERPGDAVYRGPQDHEVQTSNASELRLQVASSGSVGWWVIRR